MLKRSLKSLRAASMVEYALLVALVATVCIGSLTALGLGVDNAFQTVTAALP